MKFSTKPIKILDFDIENRPLSYWYSDRPTAEITAIASCFAHDLSTMEVNLLGRESMEEILERFSARYNEADIVTGHFIRRHDLPIINGHLMEYRMPLLAPKLTIDTKLDMHKKGDIPATQEFLGEMFGLPADKVHMSQWRWREGNRLTPEGIAATEKRASGDVLQHMLLRNYMYQNSLLKSPKIWRG